MAGKEGIRVKKIRALLFALLLLAIPVSAFANSAQPPSLTIIVYNAPSRLLLDLRLPDSTEQHPIVLEREERGGRAWETYYRFFIYMPFGVRKGISDWGELRVVNGEESFACPLPKEVLTDYASVLTLDLSTQTLSLDVSPWRTPLYIAARIILTLFIEGIVFFRFAFRDRRSWLIFLVSNLVTQGLLNILLLGKFSSVTSRYYTLAFGTISLFFAEALIFLAEAFLYSFLIREHEKRDRVLCALIGNVSSLLFGGMILFFLPL